MNPNEREPTVGEWLGRYHIAFNSMEEGLGYYMAYLINGGSAVTDEGWILHEYVGYAAKVSCLAKLAALRFGSELDEERLGGLIRDLRQAGRKRNELAHASWLGSTSSDELQTMKLFRKPKDDPDFKDVSSSDLRAAVEVLENLEMSLRGFMSDHFHPQPWLDDQPDL